MKWKKSSGKQSRLEEIHQDRPENLLTDIVLAKEDKLLRNKHLNRTYFCFCEIYRLNYHFYLSYLSIFRLYLPHYNYNRCRIIYWKKVVKGVKWVTSFILTYSSTLWSYWICSGKRTRTFSMRTLKKNHSLMKRIPTIWHNFHSNEGISRIFT